MKKKKGSFWVRLAQLFLILFIVVGWHEFGHYIAMRLNGVEVEEMAVGFGWKIGHLHIGETDFSLRILPLGGFTKPSEVGIQHMSELSFLKKNIINLMGVFNNFLLVFAVLGAVKLKYYQLSFSDFIKHLLKLPCLIILGSIGLGIALVMSLVPLLRRRIRIFSRLLVLPRELKGSFTSDLVYFSFILGVLNLFPFYPLDGGRFALDLLMKLNMSQFLLTILTSVGQALLFLMIFFASERRTNFRLIFYERIKK